jgi:hypothetical protein
MARARAGYDSAQLTIRRLLAEGWFANPERMRAVGAMTIDGRPLLDEPYAMRSASPNELRLAPKLGELMMAARALYDIGERECGFTTHERPDLIARLADGREIGIEVSEIIMEEVAHREGAIADLARDLRDALDADAALAPRGASLTFIYHPFIRAVPNAHARGALLAEILAMLRDGSWRSQVGPGPCVGPMLNRFGIELYVSATPANEPGVVNVIAPPPPAFDPSDLVACTSDRLATKKAKAARYRSDLPLWLLLVITDATGLFSDSVRVIGAMRPTIAPFERLIVTDGSVHRVIENDVIAAHSRGACDCCDAARRGSLPRGCMRVAGREPRPQCWRIGCSCSRLHVQVSA